MLYIIATYPGSELMYGFYLILLSDHYLLAPTSFIVNLSPLIYKPGLFLGFLLCPTGLSISSCASSTDFNT